MVYSPHRIIIGFIVCNLIKDALSIACLIPGKGGIYEKIYEKMVLCIKIIWGCLILFILQNIFYIIYYVENGDTKDYDTAYLVILIIINVLIFAVWLVGSRQILIPLKRIKEIDEIFKARAHVHV